MVQRMLVLVLLAAALAACGDKVPESEAAKKLGEVPKQTEEKARQDVTKALEQGAERTRQAADKAD
ncbi:MAG: hypothetical protein M0015_16830 [Betaproteobacteria bacterium]|nr:hypothetical protein [Betaproteobacteria bacterium]